MPRLPQEIIDEYREPTPEEIRQGRIDYLNSGAPYCDNGPACEDCNANRRELGLKEWK